MPGCRGACLSCGSFGGGGEGAGRRGQRLVVGAPSRSAEVLRRGRAATGRRGAVAPGKYFGEARATPARCSAQARQKFPAWGGGGLSASSHARPAQSGNREEAAPAWCGA